MEAQPQPAGPAHSAPSRALLAVRYGLPAVVVLGGILALAIDPSSWDGAAAVIGAGLSIALLNVLHRVGVDGDVDRDREAQARVYFDAHGSWPDEDQPTAEARRRADPRVSRA